MLELLALAQQCAPDIAPTTLAAVIQTESNNNPYAIGIVGGRLARQPTNSDEALETANHLAKTGWNFSLGAAQINRFNLEKMGVSYESALEPCTNIRAAATILKDCYQRALSVFSGQQQALRAAFSCYYSGNFETGFKTKHHGERSYVQKVLASAENTKIIPVITDSADKKLTVVPKIISSAEDVPEELIQAALKPKKSHIPIEFDGFNIANDKAAAALNGFESDKNTINKFDGYALAPE